MSLILVATVGGVLLERFFVGCPPDGRVGVRRGGARDTAGNGERAAHRRVQPTIVPDKGPRPPPASQARPEPLAGATRSPPRRAQLGLAADPAGRRAVPVVGPRPLVAARRCLLEGPAPPHPSQARGGPLERA